MHSDPDLHTWRDLGSVISSAIRGCEAPAVAVETLSSRLGFDSALLTISDSADIRQHTLLVNHNYPRPVAEYMLKTYVCSCPGFMYTRQEQIAIRVDDTPFDFRETRTYCDVLEPAGYHEGVTITFSAQESSRTGMLVMNTTSNRPLNHDGRLALTLLAPELAALGESSLLRVREQLPDDLLVESDATATLRWLRPGTTTQTSLPEEVLRDFAQQLRDSGRQQAGFFEKNAQGLWWRVRGYRRQADGPESTILMSLRQEGPRGNLTARELDLLGLVGRGLTNKEIAETLIISLSTVKTHVETLLAKLSQTNRAGLVAIAVDEHLCTRDFLIKH